MKPDVWTKLPHFIADELRVAANGLAFAAANSRSLMATFAYATDATPTSGGAVKTPLSREFAENFTQYQSRGGGSISRLDGVCVVLGVVCECV